jgi:hypothetical protein
VKRERGMCDQNLEIHKAVRLLSLPFHRFQNAISANEAPSPKCVRSFQYIALVFESLERK